LQRTAAATAMELVAVSEKTAAEGALEAAREKIKMLETTILVKDDLLRQTQASVQLMEATQKTLLDRMELHQTPPREQASVSDIRSTYTGEISSLKLQVDSGRLLIDAVRRQVCDEQERVKALQMQLTRQKEQVSGRYSSYRPPLHVLIMCCRMPSFSSSFRCPNSCGMLRSCGCMPQSTSCSR
jgi:hypothetical protein